MIGKMLESGKLSLSDKVQNYIDFPEKSEEEMTVGALLSHTSGLRHYNKLVAIYPNISRPEMGTLKARSLGDFLHGVSNI